MKFSNDIILEDEHVQLRPLANDDFDELLHYSLNEPDLWEYSLLRADGAENLQKYVDLALQGRAESHSYPFVVIDKNKEKVAGSTRFYDYQQGHKTVQLGYTWYGKEFQGTGLNKRCKYLMLRYAFEVLQLERVEFRADNQNKRSIAAMKSIGCIEEGVLRSNCSSPTGRRDSIVLSILKEEWLGSVKDNLLAKIQSSVQ